jgi:hypothetical protein
LSTFQKWDKLFFKLAAGTSFSAGSKDQPSTWVTSNITAAGHVPEGMALVAQELWQNFANGNAVDEFPESTVKRCQLRSSIDSDNMGRTLSGANPADAKALHNCRYDYAIDKCEVYNSGGSLDENPFLGINDGSTGCNLGSLAFRGTFATCLEGLTTKLNNTTSIVLKSAKNNQSALGNLTYEGS